MLGSEGFAIRILGVRREPGVQVSAEHVHEDRGVGGKVRVPFPALEIPSSVPSEGAHASSLGKLSDPFHQIFLVWGEIQVLHQSVEGGDERSFHERCLLEAADAGFCNTGGSARERSQLPCRGLETFYTRHHPSYYKVAQISFTSKLQGTNRNLRAEEGEKQSGDKSSIRCFL